MACVEVAPLLKATGFRTEIWLEGQPMRFVILGFCLLATACAGAAPTAPASSLSQAGGGPAVTEAKGGSDLPFKGNLQVMETVDGASHTLVGSGNGTHLGHFIFSAHITVNDDTLQGTGTSTWTAANGDQIFSSTTGEAVVNFPIVTIEEKQIITGGTGRFIGATGTIILDRSLNLLTGLSTGSFVGTISPIH
jgi:hypothetical protein